MKQKLLASLLVGQVLSVCFCAGTIAKAADKAKSWVSVNKVFHKIYAEEREKIKKSLDPIVIVEGGDLVLIKDGKREVFKRVTDKYHLFKTVAHVPLAIYVCLNDKTTGDINEKTLLTLEELKGGVEIARKNLNEWQLEPGNLKRQEEIIEASTNFIDQVLKNRNVSELELLSFTRKMAPLTLDNAYESVKIELGNVDKHMRPFKKQLSDEEWKKLYVLVISPHMPRIQERHTQYFLKLFNEKREGHRVIYCESGHTFDESFALDLVATHILDRRIAVNFYKDPERMHRDLLSDAAKKYLKVNKLNWARD